MNGAFYRDGRGRNRSRTSGPAEPPSGWSRPSCSRTTLTEGACWLVPLQSVGIRLTCRVSSGPAWKTAFSPPVPARATRAKPTAAGAMPDVHAIKAPGSLVSRVLSRGRYPRRTGPAAATIHLGARLLAYAQAANPGGERETRLSLKIKDLPPLFGLAPGGVCHAGLVAKPPVRSCRTLSPLPVPATDEQRGPSAVCSLWHFPLTHAPCNVWTRRALPATLVSWSPDFPRPSTRSFLSLSKDAVATSSPARLI